MSVQARRIAILGTGRIGEALIAGLLSSGWREPGEIAASTRRPERVGELAERYGIDATQNNLEAAAGAALVVVSVGMIVSLFTKQSATSNQQSGIGNQQSE